MRVTRMIIPWFVAVLSGCTIADEDRCLKGYTWDDNAMACQKNVSDDTDTDGDFTTDAGPVSSSDAGADSGPDADAAVPPLPEGLGSSCTATGNECSAFAEANYCALDPRNPDAPGTCTIDQCEPGGCPQAYSCCNCFDLYVFCMSEDAAVEAIANGCSCS